MPKYYLLILFLISITHSYSAQTSHFENPKSDQVFLLITGTGITISLADYMQLKPSDYKKIKGGRLKLKEIIALKITQWQIKKNIRKDGSINLTKFQQSFKDSSKIHWGGFFLGFFLLPIGVIITLFIKDEKRKDRIRSAFLGMLVAIGIGLVIGVIIAGNNII